MFLLETPLCPETHFSNGANPSIGHRDLNDDPSDLHRLYRSLPVFIPVGKPRLLNISDQNTRATIDLSQQP
jgi:hypothetical protein